jgi:hypothetical protein
MMTERPSNVLEDGEIMWQWCLWYCRTAIEVMRRVSLERWPATHRREERVFANDGMGIQVYFAPRAKPSFKC